jgi:hypothetical protein
MKRSDDTVRWFVVHHISNNTVAHLHTGPHRRLFMAVLFGKSMVS